MDRRSRLGFAKIARLKAYGFDSGEVSGALQCDQQLLDLVEFDIIAGEARDVVGKSIAFRPNVGHVVLPGQIPDASGCCALGLRGHGFFSSQCSILPGENPLKLGKIPFNQ
jgi:hypothetical protein